MLDKVEDLFSTAQNSLFPHSLLSDAGYYSYQNVLAENEYNINLIIPPSKERKIKEYTDDNGNVSRMEEICHMIKDGVRVTITTDSGPLTPKTR